MENCRQFYVRHLISEEMMNISFLYGSQSMPQKEFLFLRSKNEKLETALTRMKSKIESAMFPDLRKKKKKGIVFTGDEAKVPIVIKVLHNGCEILGDVKNVDAWTQGSQVKINDLVYDIFENGPLVSFISLQKSIMSSFITYPKICLECALQQDSTFTWFRSKNSCEESSSYSALSSNGESWVEIATGFLYTVSEADVGHKLKVACVPKYGVRVGRKEEAVSLNPVLRRPQNCPFEDRHACTRAQEDCESIRFLSYNILADLYFSADEDMSGVFPYCPTRFLDFDYRKQLYIKEILGYNADIICLQEVDRKAYQNDLLPVLSAHGFAGVYIEKGSCVPEELACFFRASKFRLVYEECKALREILWSFPVFQELCNKLSENSKLMEKFGNRATALQVVILECTDVPKRKLVIGNTHLFFHPDSDNIRLIQAFVCVKYLECVVMNCKQELLEDPFATCSLLFCGDFNSCPENGVFQLMTEGSLPDDCPDWKSNPEEAVNGIPLNHSLLLESACGTPSYTNYTEKFVGCLDYIFYDKNYFYVKEVVPFPEHEKVIEHTALPSEFFPSDHIALICTLTWK